MRRADVGNEAGKSIASGDPFFAPNEADGWSECDGARCSTRVGSLAGCVAMFVWRASAIHALDLDEWYAPYAIVPLAVVLALAAYRLWVSLAGRPMFQDMLAEPQAKG